MTKIALQKFFPFTHFASVEIHQISDERPVLAIYIGDSDSWYKKKVFKNNSTTLSQVCSFLEQENIPNLYTGILETHINKLLSSLYKSPKSAPRAGTYDEGFRAGAQAMKKEALSRMRHEMKFGIAPDLSDPDPFLAVSLIDVEDLNQVPAKTEYQQIVDMIKKHGPKSYYYTKTQKIDEKEYWILRDPVKVKGNQIYRYNTNEWSLLRPQDVALSDFVKVETEWTSRDMTLRQVKKNYATSFGYTWLGASRSELNESMPPTFSDVPLTSDWVWLKIVSNKRSISNQELNQDLL